MTDNEKELNHLMNLVADHIDLKHCQEVDERYRRALTWEEVDRPPLIVQSAFGSVIKLPSPWDTFQYYSYGETFENPVAMLQNMLLERVVPGLLLKDDNPLAVRNNHGTIQVASLLGGHWKISGDNYPWIECFNSIESIKDIANFEEKINLQGGLAAHSFETLKFYNEKIDEYPPCSEAIQISMPDFQGPYDTAEQLWGSNIYYAFYDSSDLLNKLLSKIVDTMLVVAEQFRKYTLDRLDPVADTQHGYMIPGRLLVRNDSAIMLSSDMYGKFICPHDQRLLQAIGSGSLHFCGNGEHLIEKMLEIPALRGLDFGEPGLMDIDTIYAKCHRRNVAITNVNPTREALISGRARIHFPTGVVFVYYTNDLNDAMEVVRKYKCK